MKIIFSLCLTAMMVVVSPFVFARKAEPGSKAVSTQVKTTVKTANLAVVAKKTSKKRARVIFSGNWSMVNGKVLLKTPMKAPSVFSKNARPFAQWTGEISSILTQLHQYDVNSDSLLAANDVSKTIRGYYREVLTEMQNLERPLVLISHKNIFTSHGKTFTMPAGLCGKINKAYGTANNTQCKLNIDIILGGRKDPKAFVMIVPGNMDTISAMRQMEKSAISLPGTAIAFPRETKTTSIFFALVKKVKKIIPISQKYPKIDFRGIANQMLSGGSTSAVMMPFRTQTEREFNVGNIVWPPQPPPLLTIKPVGTPSGIIIKPALENKIVTSGKWTISADTKKLGVVSALNPFKRPDDSKAFTLWSKKLTALLTDLAGFDPHSDTHINAVDRRAYGSERETKRPASREEFQQCVEDSSSAVLNDPLYILWLEYGAGLLRNRISDWDGPYGYNEYCQRASANNNSANNSRNNNSLFDRICGGYLHDYALCVYQAQRPARCNPDCRLAARCVGDNIGSSFNQCKWVTYHDDYLIKAWFRKIFVGLQSNFGTPIGMASAGGRMFTMRESAFKMDGQVCSNVNTLYGTQDTNRNCFMNVGIIVGGQPEPKVYVTFIPSDVGIVKALEQVNLQALVPDLPGTLFSFTKQQQPISLPGAERVATSITGRFSGSSSPQTLRISVRAIANFMKGDTLNRVTILGHWPTELCEERDIGTDGRGAEYASRGCGLTDPNNIENNTAGVEYNDVLTPGQLQEYFDWASEKGGAVINGGIDVANQYGACHNNGCITVRDEAGGEHTIVPPTYAEDGTSAASSPDITTPRQTDDTTETLRDGTEIVRLSNGSTVTTFPNGDSRVENADGTTVDYIKNADGTMTVNTYDSDTGDLLSSNIGTSMPAAGGQPSEMPQPPEIFGNLGVTNNITCDVGNCTGYDAAGGKYDVKIGDNSMEVTFPDGTKEHFELDENGNSTNVPAGTNVPTAPVTDVPDESLMGPARDMAGGGMYLPPPPDDFPDDTPPGDDSGGGGGDW
ncbi:MAG: hypothetical protein HY877_02770 [Deltaproteobacteria bacterium]|nr:hypothetical protein [Deltaproteobacteria bacterium]